MHNYTPIKNLIGLFISALMIVFAISLTKTPSAQDRKAQSLKPHTEILIRTTKLKAPFSVSIKKVSSENLVDDNKLLLTANIKTELDIPRVHYKWILPSNINPKPGTNIEGVISNITAQGGFAWQSEFIDEYSENQKIYLRIWVDNDANKLTSTAQYNTKLQDKIDFEKNELIERQNKYLTEHPELIKTFK